MGQTMKRLLGFLGIKRTSETLTSSPQTGINGESPRTAAPTAAPPSPPGVSSRPDSFRFGKKKKKKRKFPPLPGGESGTAPIEQPQNRPSPSLSADSCEIAGEPLPEPAEAKPSLLPGSEGEHRLQEKYESSARAINFYEKQVLDYLAPAMKEFIARQEFLFISTADRHGECDCTSKFGQPGFIRVLGDKYLMYPEYRGNGVYANAGNISENPHIAMLMIDFTRDTIGLHVNGMARIVENHELRRYSNKLPADVLEEMNREGKKCPERWVMVEVEEAYIQCSKHIPLMKKADKSIDWGTDSIAAKGGDYFQLQNLSLYRRVGGDKAMELAADMFCRKVLDDPLVRDFFKDVDMEAQRLKQKNFLTLAFGGPHHYSGQDLRKSHKHLVEKRGMTDRHFDRILELFRETLEELGISEKERNGMLEILASTRDDILNR
jgi:truncated hemoglobin YjbI